jgi:hypothetical protein
MNTRRNSEKNVVGVTVVFLISYVPYHAFWTYITCTAKPKIYEVKIIKIIPNKITIYSTCILVQHVCF